MILFNKKFEFLLVKKFHETEKIGGLWVLPGGGGGFADARSFSALAKQEVEYDLNENYNKNKKKGQWINFEVEEGAIKIFKTQPSEKKIIIYTYCNNYEGTPTPNNKDIIDFRWFPIKKIREFGMVGKIAYGNHLVIYDFYRKFIEI